MIVIMSLNFLQRNIMQFFSSNSYQSLANDNPMIIVDDSQ